MLSASYQEKVQPSVDELDYNSDEFQSDGSSGVKIGINSLLCTQKFLEGFSQV